MRALEDLKLVIPSIDLLEARQFLGGGTLYAEVTLPEVTVYPEGLPDGDTHDPDDQRDFDRDGHEDGEDGHDQGTGTEDQDNENDPLNDLLNTLNEQQKELIEKLNITITIDPNLSVAGEYNSKDNTITLQDYNDTSLISELIHAYQDDLGILDNKSRSNVEFQEHVLTDIWEFYENDGFMPNSTVDDSDWSKYYEWLEEITHFGDESQPFDRDCFDEHFEEFFESFLERNEGEPYGQDPNNDYDWMWDAFFNFMGF